MSKKPIVNKITGTSPLDIKKINDNFEEVSKKMNTSEDVNLDELKVGCCCGLGNIKQYSGGGYKLQNAEIYIRNGMCFVSKSNFSHPIIINFLSEYNGYYGAHIVIEPSLCPNGMSPQKSTIFEKLLRVFIYNSRMKNNEEINIYFWTYAKNSTEADILLYRQICKNGYEYWFAYGHYGYTYDFYCVDVKLYKNVFSTVATTGSYNDLSDKPELFSGDYNDLKNKPEIFDGNYNDLYNKPKLFSGDYNDLINKPTFARVATSANYQHLNNRIRSITISATKSKITYFEGGNGSDDRTRILSSSTSKVATVDFYFPYRTSVNGEHEGIAIRKTSEFNALNDDFLTYLGNSSINSDIKCIRIIRDNKETFSDEIISALQRLGSNYIQIFKDKSIYLFVAFGDDSFETKMLESYDNSEAKVIFGYDEYCKVIYKTEDKLLSKCITSGVSSEHTHTASEIGALPISGNTKNSPITGSIYLQNNKEIIGMTTDGSTASIARVNSNNKVILGNVYKNTNLQSYSNPTVTLNKDKTYTIYHEGNAPKALWSAGDKTAETGTEAPNAGHMCMNTIYNNGYPCTYGNLLTLSGSGKSELAMEWTGNNTPTTGRLYYRSKRDTGGVAWGNWKKIAYTDDVINKSYVSGTLDHCARSADTGNSNTNKYFKLATFNITENYGSVSAEYSVGFSGHGMSTSPHHKLGVWIKRQDSTFSMDLKVWGATNDNYATYLLVKTGTYQATLYAFLRIQYCTLYMSCLSRMYNSATVQYYTGATPIDTVGSTNVYGTLMDKPSVTGGVECIFSGSIKSTGALDNAWKNKGTCVDSNGYFNVPENGVYHIIGRAWKTNSVYLCNVTTGSKAPMPMLSNLAPSDSTIITFNTPFKGTKNQSYLLRQDEIGTKLNYAVFTILKLN